MVACKGKLLPPLRAFRRMTYGGWPNARRKVRRMRSRSPEAGVLQMCHCQAELPTLDLASTMTSRTSAAVASAPGCQIRYRGLGADLGHSR
jgi:hypothetical protein